MSKTYKHSELYVQRMIDACKKIQEYLQNTNEKEFMTQKESYDAVCLQFLYLGEQIKNLQESPERVIQHFPDDVDWSGLKGLRNQIGHNYISINPEKIWKFANENILEVQIALKKILKKRFGK